MIRSNFAITRVLMVPYGILVTLYLSVVGGAGAWLTYEVRAVETRLLLEEIMAAIVPLAESLRTRDALAAVRGRDASLVADAEALFAELPALRNFSVRGPESGYRLEHGANGVVSFGAAASLPENARRADALSSPGRRLHEETDALFLVRFDMSEAPKPLVILDFAFDRSMLLGEVNRALGAIERSILVFSAAGALSILIALAITVVAMRMTRQLEGYFQEIYHRASLTETAAQLVHDLRNPLAALRANTKALLVSPAQTQEIVRELDRDIVTLNERLSAFLNLTRQRDEGLESVDVRELVADALRLAEPILAENGLTAEIDIASDLPRPHWQKAAVRDALLNVIINAGQSGHQDGAIRITANNQGNVLEIAVEDRGKGVPEQNLPHLFEAFYTTKDDGNGLGLAIVKSIVTAHQGRVRAENRPGGGARILLALPLQRKEPPRWWSRLQKNSRA